MVVNEFVEGDGADVMVVAGVVITVVVVTAGVVVSGVVSGTTVEEGVTWDDAVCVHPARIMAATMSEQHRIPKTREGLILFTC